MQNYLPEIAPGGILKRPQPLNEKLFAKSLVLSGPFGPTVGTYLAKAGAEETIGTDALWIPRK